MLKREREANSSMEADMWCHFGAAIIRGPSEGNLNCVLSRYNHELELRFIAYNHEPHFFCKL